LTSAFDFDLDEVWAPVSPQLKSLQRNHLQQIGRASSASSSTHSLYRESRKPTDDINLSVSTITFKPNSYFWSLIWTLADMVLMWAIPALKIQ